MMLPKNLLYIEEESWNCHPYGLTISTNPQLKQFQLIIESMNLNDNGSTDVFSYDTNEFLERDSRRIDFVNDENGENKKEMQVRMTLSIAIRRNWRTSTSRIPLSRDSEVTGSLQLNLFLVAIV